ncbi:MULTISPECIES: cold-shock protein [Corynebacterium]|jgi:CspA family cold shock protein|uniref:Cold shock protein CspB n=1 Tax=Corynebacterium provencense TaxID=1737425 RepID=A0A2Z3YT45_9CORY|nr:MULTISPECIES: cold shock domain-containing protein [Corynebacterium]AWT26861.1 Cold shock protein CspB [Corynebacterium provencense]MCI1257052.1 cold shock domain-containing protein [Corynebacterium provencense]
MPTGKVKWFDADKGYGFVTNPGQEDVYVGRQVLPEGVTELVQGQRIEYDLATGLRGRGPEALRVTVLDQGPRRAAHRYPPEKLHGLVQDTVSLLENRIQPALEAGRRPGRKEGHQVAEILRTIARELDA